jgi:uncharacterized membrane protein YjjB (DUF3815 family)
MDGINNLFPWRLIMRTMRRLNDFNTISYSYTDRQVEVTVKYSIVIGIIMGSLITSMVLEILR